MSIPQPSGFFIKGVLNGAPHTLVIGPFGFLFGVVATEAGLSVFEALSFSVLVVAGAAQLTALELMQDNTPTVIVILSALALNLRMALYSASLTPHLGTARFWQRMAAAYTMVDQSYATSILQYENNPQMSVQQKLAFFFGVATPVIPIWYALTFLGALVGQSVPPKSRWILPPRLPLLPFSPRCYALCRIFWPLWRRSLRGFCFMPCRITLGLCSQV